VKIKIQQLLKSLEPSANKFWNISPETGAFLNLLIQDRDYSQVLEIGTSNGYSGIWLAEALSHTGGTLHTIESNLKKRFNLGSENFKKSGLTNINHILGHAPEDLPKTPRKFDMAFFDATKEEHLSYWQTLHSRIKQGGCIITDNAISHKKALAPYLKAVNSTPGWRTELLAIGTGLLVSFKK
jgi:predicted O-methyltransferase YrrM